MSDNTNVSARDFYNFVMRNPSLQDKFVGITDESQLMDLAVKLGKENGYLFTAEELRTSISQAEGMEESELDDSLLAAVAGGKSASGSSGSIIG